MATLSINSQSVEARKDDMLKSFLGWIGNYHQKNASDAEDSITLLNLGTKTQFVQEWESFFDNPVDSFMSTKSSVELALRKIVNGMVSTYLLQRKDMLTGACIVHSDGVNSCFCISLKEDTLDNRIEVNEFFEFYDEQSFSSAFPVYFQYVPTGLMAKINPLKTIL